MTIKMVELITFAVSHKHFTHCNNEENDEYLELLSDRIISSFLEYTLIY